MTYKGVLTIVVTIIMIVLGYRGGLSGSQDSSPTRTQAGIPAEKVADIVHAVIQADRAFYTVHVVERLQRWASWLPRKTGRLKRRYLFPYSSWRNQPGWWQILKPRLATN